MGWQGLGGDAIQPTDNDFNQLSPSGFIQAQTNTPVSPSLFMGFNVRHGGAYQFTIVGRNKRYFAQSCEAGKFQGWDEFYHTGNKPTPDDVGALASNGTAAAATKLETARQINGVAFDGSKNINLPLIGYGQTWQVFTSRVANTTYTNSTGSPICVSVTVAMATGNNAATASLNINGKLIQSSVSRYSDNNKVVFVSAIIPTGATYSVSGVQGTISTWAELR
ncbi:Uncharacterised protein [Citrobacter freundii]|nr:Uncharacterised protein [Citrobacter freundii]